MPRKLTALLAALWILLTALPACATSKVPTIP